jgi:phosphoglycolate phosphatase
VKIAPRSVVAIAFDLDGTLVDSAPDIARALNLALAASRFDTFDLDEVRPWIGDGPDVLIARALQRQGMENTPDGLALRLRREFDAATLAAPLGLGLVYPGIRELLESVHQRVPLAVVTNKPMTLARAVLQAAGLLEFMTSVSGADRPELRKPGPAMLLRMAADFGVPPRRLLMVGDGPADVGSARAAGCPAALVGWGYAAAAVADDAKVLRVATPAALSVTLRSGLATLQSTTRN